MNDFLVRIKSEDELINGIKMLNDIGALGAKISYGTHLPDSYDVYDIINKTIEIWREPEDDNDICAFSISYDDDEYRNENFANLYGKNHIQISLATKYDIKMGDVPKGNVSYHKMIDKTIKLMNSKRNGKK